MAQVSRRATCHRDPPSGGRGAVCLTGHDITIDGEDKVVFNYSGPVPCRDCAGSCPNVQPGLFTLRGRANTLENFTMQYFPSGIHVRSGRDHTVTGIRDSRICEHAIDVDSRLPKHSGPGAGSNIRIANNVFTGHTASDSPHVCLDHLGRTSKCGLDKAIQVNGGIVTIENNVIDTIGQPVGIIGGRGTHTISGNRTTGDPSDQNVCQAYSVSGAEAKALFTGNVIDYCKFGIRVADGATAEASGNTITNAYVSAISVRKGKHGGCLVKGAANRIRHAGFFNVFECQVGAIVDKDDPAARIDFGGGDFAAMPVVGAVSPGGNVLCEGSLNAVWDRTDGCSPDAGAGGSIGLRHGCSDVIPPVVTGPSPLTISTDGTRACTPAECQF